MEMFLMALALSLFGVAVSAAAFAAAVGGNPQQRPREAPPAPAPSVGRSQGFFADAEWSPEARRVPIEALLLQIEAHVRLEQAAAEAFQQAPTPDLLHVRTASPLVH